MKFDKQKDTTMKKHLFRLMLLAAMLATPMVSRAQGGCTDYVDVPYATGFEELQTGDLPACWTRYGVSTGAVSTVFPSAYRYAGNAHNSEVYFEFESTNGTLSQTAALPKMQNISGLKLSFYASAQSSFGCLMEVGVMEDSTFVPVDTVELIYTTNWATGYRPYAVLFDTYTGTGECIAIRVKGTGSGQYTLMLDDLSVSVANAPEVSLPALGATDVDVDYTITATCNVEGATFTWTSSMEAAGLATMNYTDSVLTINYTAGGTDTVRVTASNAYGGGMAMMLVNVRDCSPRTNLPWEEDFSNATALDCWTVYDFDGTTTSNWRRDDGGFMRTSYNMDGNANEWLITPAIVLPADADSVKLVFDAYGSNYSTYTSHLTVRLAVGAGLDTALFADTLFADTPPNNSWGHYSFALDGYLGDTICVAFVYDSYNDNGIRVDNVAVRSSLAPKLNPIAGPGTADVNIAARYGASLMEGATENLAYTWTSTMEAAGNATLSATFDSVEMVYSAVGRDTLTVVAENDYGSDTAYYIVNVRDLSPVETFPYTMGFEADEGDTLFWQLVSSSVNTWVIDTAAHNGTGSRALYISNDGGVSNTYIFGTQTYAYAYRAFNFTEAGQYDLTYDWRAMGEGGTYSTYDFIRVFLAPATLEIGTTGISGLGATSLPTGCIAADGGNALLGQSDWQAMSTTVDVPTAGMWQLVFYWRNDFSDGSNPAAAIDNISLAPLTCSSPTALTLDNADETTLELSWTPRGEESSWEVSVDGVSTVVNSPMYTATGLTAATAYEVRVRAICNTGDTSSAAIATFYTSCGIQTLPYNENFDNDGYVACWTLLDLDGNGSSWSHNINGYFESESNYSTGADNVAISPAIEVPASAASVTMSWDVLVDHWYSTSSYLVLVSPTGGNALADFTDTVFSDNYDGDFVTRSVSLNGYAGQTIRVAFRHQGSGSSYMDIDNLYIRESNMPNVTLAAPAAVITGDTAHLSATLVEGSTTGLTYTWSSQMATAGNAVLTVVGDSVATLIYSAGGTDTVTVIAANSYGADTAVAVIVVQQCDLVTALPYTVDFEVDNACWQALDHNGDGHTWFYSDETSETALRDAHSGERYLASESYDLTTYSGSLTPDNWLVSPAIQLPSDSATLSWYHMAGYQPDYYEHYAVYVSTAGDGVSDFLATTPVFETTLGYDDYMTWNQQQVNLQDYLGQTVRIAFRHYNCNNQYFLGLDDISVTNTNGTTSPSDTPGPIDTTVVTTYTVTVTAEDPTMGSVSPAGAHVVNAGDSFTATATPNSGYRFFGWRGAAAVTLTDNPITVTVNSDMTLEAVFVPTGTEPETYTVTVNYDQSRGTVLGAGTYNAGASVTLTATPYEGFRFDGWSNGQTDSIITFTLTEDVTLTANFVEEVGIDEVEGSRSISLYPNPATTSVTLSGLKPGAGVTIVDIHGREVAKFEIRNSKLEIDVSTLPRGTYFVRTTGAEGTAVGKLLVK